MSKSRREKVLSKKKKNQQYNPKNPNVADTGQILDELYEEE